jgi:predicted Fe-Mo cluster-binding NifX family protein
VTAVKIAIPTFGARVSPRFDCAQSVLVVTVEDGTPSKPQELLASGWAPHQRINKLLELGVDTVLCGGIDCWSVESLQSAGVTIYGWVTGEIEGALAALLSGDLDSNVLANAGYGRRSPRHGDVASGSSESERGGKHGRGGDRGRCGRHGRGGPGGRWDC